MFEPGRVHTGAMTSTAQLSVQTGSAAVRPHQSTRIVVGVDASQGSLNALLWAFGEARARNLTVHAVLAWQFHPSWGDPGLGTMFPVGPVVRSGMPASMSRLPPPRPAEAADLGEAAAAAEMNDLLDAAISNAIEADTDSTSDPIRITRELAQGHAAQVLLDIVNESDLMVVGSHGHGGFVGTLLGSISHHVVSHSLCPVVVVPAGQRTARA